MYFILMMEPYERQSHRAEGDPQKEFVWEGGWGDKCLKSVTKNLKFN